MSQKLFFIIAISILVVSGAIIYKIQYDAKRNEKPIAKTPPSQLAVITSTPKPTQNVLGKQTIENTPTATRTVTPTNVVEKGLPPMEIDSKKTYKATMTTSAGVITLKLNADKTPITVNNFVHLARTKFYDKTIFHRVIKGFMIQGGDPTGTGSGGPGYTFPDEKFDGDYTRGTLAMANAGPNTNGSQFFIMHANGALPKNYVIFGSVISGIETVDAIASAPMKSGGEGSSPVTPVSITSITISEE
jgi:cyclophilin family peptidyl-prolyl cis-trans isomerase